MSEKIPVGGDHAGYQIKAVVVEYLKELGFEVEDFGVESETRVDYPDFAGKVAGAVSRGEAQRGILVCGTGIGMAIAANKYPGVRAAVANDEELAAISRQHNNANVLALGGRIVNPEQARKIVKIWLETAFEGGRHAERIGKISQIEKDNAPGC